MIIASSGRKTKLQQLLQTRRGILPEMVLSLTLLAKHAKSSTLATRLILSLPGSGKKCYFIV